MLDTLTLEEASFQNLIIKLLFNLSFKDASIVCLHIDIQD